MKVGTDGVLLGSWAHGGNRILDVGTGTGLIALMMAQRFPQAEVTAIDIDTVACEQASENVSMSPFYDRVHVVESSLQDFVSTKKFDAVVSNPPYFNDALKNPDGQRRMARHTDALSYAELFQGVERLLADDGEFSAIIPFDCRSRFETEALLRGYSPSRVCAVRTTPRKPPRRFLLSFRKRPASCVEIAEEVLEIAPSQRSGWYQALTQDFYL